MNPTEPGQDDQREALVGLFEVSAKILARSGDPAALLDWMAMAGPSLAPKMALPEMKPGKTRTF